MTSVLLVLKFEGGKGHFRDSWSALFFLVKSEMANFFLVNQYFYSTGSREVWFSKIIFRETRTNCLIFRELWKDLLIFRETWSRPPPLYHPQICLFIQRILPNVTPLVREPNWWVKYEELRVAFESVWFNRLCFEWQTMLNLTGSVTLCDIWVVADLYGILLCAKPNAYINLMYFLT